MLVVSILLPAYLLLGCAYKTVWLGKRGLEACPHADFWASLPGLVADGCRTSYYLLISGCRRTGRPEEFWEEL